jgi:signal transduction histidine kinase
LELSPLSRWRLLATEFARRAAGPASFNNYVLTLFAIGSLWVTLVVDIGVLRRPILQELAAGVFATGVTLAWLLLARRFFASRESSRHRSTKVFAAFALAGLLRNASLTLASIPLGLVNPSTRIVSSLVTTFALLLFASLTANRWQQSKISQDALFVERQKLLWLSATYDEKVNQAQRDLMRDLETDLYPAIRRVADELKGQVRGNAQTAEYLVGTVGDVVRPLWTRITQATDNILEQLDSIAAKDPISVGFSQLFDVKTAIRPTLTVGLLFVISLTVVPATGISARPVEFALASGFVWLFLMLVRLSWPAKARRLSLLSATFLLGLLYTLAFSVGLAISNGINGDLATIMLRLTFSIGGALVLARFELIEQSRATIEAELQSQNRQLEELISGLRKQIWVHRRRAAWVLHGPVQSALMATAMALTQGSPSQEDRQQLLKNIQGAVDSLANFDQSHNGLSGALEEISSVWRRSCSVTWKVGESLESDLGADPETAACLVEIAREGVSNAIRHGHAKEIEIEISAPAKNLVEICIQNDGSQLVATQPGLGSAMFDQISLRWWRNNVAGGVRLCAQVVRARH